ncbi:sulfurtransferase complex subunit TusB [Methylomarinum sp. Ch1-1]|uniref:Sulfurtransferase complex subunit TusB n=1 Tax=Methylomarinum roseum TaxID=3067653 RepID=A0AAU7NUK4_9GAMM|nr:sulfurtransferase complex subunit TusB [Methylomarinum sp. Ch1-1]MDP4519284.1 sulfurtransferase complex subunit TusB [Methylomarinum sp. Ch1-1]
MLHLIGRTPVDCAILERIDSGDDVVFQQVAVWSALKGHALRGQLRRLLENNSRLHVLRDDLLANGIEVEQLQAGVEVIDYSGLVELAVANKVCKTWR